MGKECTVAFMKEFLQLTLENHRALFYLQIAQSAAGESANLRVMMAYREYDKDPQGSSETNTQYRMFLHICNSVARSVAVPAPPILHLDNAGVH